jgi:glycosidase
VVKGRAGSPYAVKDYYNVNPDLAEDPANRLNEFRALIDRTHKSGLKVIIDIVPNHVARRYEGLSNPAGAEDFGSRDDKTVIYKTNNNFYYIPGEHFQVPQMFDGYKPLGGENHPLLQTAFEEFPAKWTGNGSRQPKPDCNDWYETVKLNYGVRPDGTRDFPGLPEGFDKKGYQEHDAYWKEISVPDTWLKFRDIALYWTRLGVDGFRYDMAEMVPVEFWSFMNSAIKMENSEAFILAEVYNPALYRDYIHVGKMDYLYDKVELYDTLKAIMQGHESTDRISGIQQGLADIEHRMVHFLENHDEQRIASPGFAGSAVKGKPAMVLSATISTSPTMIYFGQEVGEPAAENAGFGSPSRTSIFDYVGVPHHQRWLNHKKFDGGQLSVEEMDLRDFYKRLLNFTINSSALMGSYQEIHHHNRWNTPYYNDQVFSFVRYSATEKLVIVTNFNATETYGFDLEIPINLISAWGLDEGELQMTDQLYRKETVKLKVTNGLGKTRVIVGPLESFIFKID